MDEIDWMLERIEHWKPDAIDIRLQALERLSTPDVYVGLHLESGAELAPPYAVGYERQLFNRFDRRIDRIRFPRAGSNWGTIRYVGFYNLQGVPICEVHLDEPVEVTEGNELEVEVNLPPPPVGGRWRW